MFGRTKKNDHEIALESWDYVIDDEIDDDDRTIDDDNDNHEMGDDENVQRRKCWKTVVFVSLLRSKGATRIETWDIKHLKK